MKRRLAPGLLAALLATTAHAGTEAPQARLDGITGEIVPVRSHRFRDTKRKRDHRKEKRRRKAARIARRNNRR